MISDRDLKEVKERDFLKNYNIFRIIWEAGYEVMRGYSLLEVEIRTDRSFVLWQEEQYTDLEPTGILSGSISVL